MSGVLTGENRDRGGHREKDGRGKYGSDVAVSQGVPTLGGRRDPAQSLQRECGLTTLCLWTSGLRTGGE